MQRAAIGLALVMAALTGAPAHAQELPPMFGRYMPLYPGLYLDAAYSQDDRDRSFDTNGTSRASATPQAPGGKTGFPETSGVVAFTWHFPMFESYGLGFFSDRTHVARMTLRYVDTHTEGALTGFIRDTSDDARSEADDLKNSGSGVGDLTLELGSFLAGSGGWRERERHPFALLIMGGVNIPTGVYERDGPNSAGSNTWYFQGKLGLHWEPWEGGFLDAGYAYRDYQNTEESEFGGLAPYKQGDDQFYDIGLTQRLMRDLYFGGTFAFRDGDPNVYRDPRYAPNAPPHPDMNTDTYPTPGHYRDNGTELDTRTVSLYYFITQRWMAAFHYTHPQDGQSGQFLLPFSTKTPKGCIPGSQGCTEGQGQTILVDGLGGARVFSTERITLTITHNFGLGDTFTCAGCKP